MTAIIYKLDSKNLQWNFQRVINNVDHQIFKALEEQIELYPDELKVEYV